MSTHTPGPWKIDGRGYRPDTKNGGEFVPIHAERGGWIADVREPDANARLIAATPDLLAALKLALRWIDPDASPVPLSNREVCNRIRAAIAKAEGRS
jgi:hypothetical protein